ncbi:MAG: hypothetical protein VB142_03460 [Burkholderia sp.]
MLPGVMRGALLAAPALGAGERILLMSDELARADGLLICNALRGAML